jgi:competence protein ComEC
MVHSVDPFSRIGVASLRIPEYTGWASVIYGLYYLPLFGLIRSLSSWQPLRPALKTTHPKRLMLMIAISGQFLFLTIVVVHPWSERRPTGKLTVDFLDVGQGDSALVTFPDNSTLLIDGGGRPGPFKNSSAENDAEVFERESRSIGESVVSKYLWWRGLDHVDYLLATHADADHIDGLNDVARNFKVRAALVARTPETDAEYLSFANTLSMRGIPTRLIGAGDVLEFGQVKLRVLWPEPFGDSNASSTNNDSIVLQLEYGERAVLLTGDIEKAGEEQMLSVGADLRADVVKVAHHGSKTSSIQSLIEAVRPRYALISVGQASIFGHPNPEVVERWQHSGAQVMKTGDYGTITVVTDGKDLTIETFVKKN